MDRYCHRHPSHCGGHIVVSIHFESILKYLHIGNTVQFKINRRRCLDLGHPSKLHPCFLHILLLLHCQYHLNSVNCTHCHWTVEWLGCYRHTSMIWQSLILLYVSKDIKSVCHRTAATKSKRKRFRVECWPECWSSQSSLVLWSNKLEASELC